LEIGRLVLDLLFPSLFIFSID